MAVTTHMCRGNFRSSWAAEGGYDFVAEALFGELDVDGFFLEYDDARSGGFEPLRFVPKGKMVVLGLVTTSAASSRARMSSSGGSRRPRSIRADRAAVPLAAVRLLLDGRGQRPDSYEQEVAKLAWSSRPPRRCGVERSGPAGGPEHLMRAALTERAAR
jgi:hypothetical protein